jgi:predicted nicotinamide N-methyase
MTWRPVSLGGRTYEVLCAPAAEELADQEGLGYLDAVWAELWPAGLALADHLARGPRPGGPVLELGSGVGIGGMAAALRGARVVLTDRVPLALEAARASLEAAGILHQARLIAADWLHWPLTARFPLVLGSEITYLRELHPPLLNVVRAATAPGGTLLLVDRGRDSGRRFDRLLLGAGWRLTEYPLEIAGQRRPGRLVRAVNPP